MGRSACELALLVDVYRDGPGLALIDVHTPLIGLRHQRLLSESGCAFLPWLCDLTRLPVCNACNWSGLNGTSTRPAVASYAV